jgi:hypothetical protein
VGVTVIKGKRNVSCCHECDDVMRKNCRGKLKVIVIYEGVGGPRCRMTNSATMRKVALNFGEPRHTIANSPGTSFMSGRSK